MRARRSPNATDIGISLHIVHADQEIECRDAVQQPPININIDVNKSSYRSRYKHVYILVTLLASFSVFSFIFRTLVYEKLPLFPLAQTLRFVADLRG